MRRLSVPALSFVLVLLVAGPPWPPVRRGFASAYCAVINSLLGSLTFGKGGHIHLSAGDTAPDGRRPQGEVSTDSTMVMSIVGYRGSAVHGLSARRDGYLPLVVVLAAIAAAPLARRAKLRCLLAGALIETAVIVASIWLFVVWDFAVGLGVAGIYDLSPFARDGLDLAFRALLLPPGNRFIIPLLIVTALAWAAAATARAARAA
jgi:hypothetical protein